MKTVGELFMLRDLILGLGALVLWKCIEALSECLVCGAIVMISRVLLYYYGSIAGVLV